MYRLNVEDFTRVKKGKGIQGESYTGTFVEVKRETWTVD